MKVRPEQADGLGGCAPCQFAPVEGGPAAQASGGGSAPKSVIVVDPTKTDTYLGIELVDARKAPVPFARYIVTPPGRTPIEGTLDVNGKVRLEGLDPGTCQITFPNLDRRDFI